jgi:hypothetical protein
MLVGGSKAPAIIIDDEEPEIIPPLDDIAQFVRSIAYI